MGYYTDFTLDYKGSLPETEFKRSFEEVTNYPLEDYPYLSEVKWYDYVQDMVTLSKIYPKVLFILGGKGEEAEDLFSYYFFNGEHSGGRAEITYLPIDEDLLATVKNTIPEYYV